MPLLFQAHPRHLMIKKASGDLLPPQLLLPRQDVAKHPPRVRPQLHTDPHEFEYIDPPLPALIAGNERLRLPQPLGEVNLLNTRMVPRRRLRQRVALVLVQRLVQPHSEGSAQAPLGEVDQRSLREEEGIPMRRILYALIPLTLALGSSTSTGVQVDERALTSFEKGKTTIADVVARLGQPTSNMLLNTGQRNIGHTYIQAQARPESFIPIFGPLVGGADNHFSNVSLTFDRNGVLESYSSTQSQFGSGNGVASVATAGDHLRHQPRKSGNPH